MSEKLNLPLAIFAVETMCLVVFTTLGLVAATIVTISTAVLIVQAWKRRDNQKRRLSDFSI